MIPPVHYSSIVSKMKELVEKVKRFNDDVTFYYDTLSRKVAVHQQNNVETIKKGKNQKELEKKVTWNRWWNSGVLEL